MRPRGASIIKSMQTLLKPEQASFAGEDKQRAEAIARKNLKQQIKRQEALLAQAVCSAFPEKLQLEHSRSRGARLRSLGELEEIRDHLIEQNRSAQNQLNQLKTSQQAAKLQLQQMLQNPGAHRGIRISQKEMGEPGCGVYRVAPRLGIVGRMMGWWQVKMSSGCP